MGNSDQNQWTDHPDYNALFLYIAKHAPKEQLIQLYGFGAGENRAWGDCQTLRANPSPEAEAAFLKRQRIRNIIERSENQTLILDTARSLQSAKRKQHIKPGQPGVLDISNVKHHSLLKKKTEQFQHGLVYKPSKQHCLGEQQQNTLTYNSPPSLADEVHRKITALDLKVQIQIDQVVDMLIASLT